MTSLHQAITVAQETLQTVRLGENFQITPQGLIVVGRPTFEQCDALWETLLTMEKTIQFAIGDAMKYIRARFEDKADQIISARTGWSFETIRNYEWVADKVPQDVRRLTELSFSHHQSVAGLPPDQQSAWLAKAIDGDKPWPVNRLRAAIKASGDIPVSAWFLLVKADSEVTRDALMTELESRGFVCTATERRSPAKEGENESVSTGGGTGGPGTPAADA